jgi:hypothetical protein
MRNNTTDLLGAQLTTAFIKSGLTTAEFVQHIIDTRDPIEASVTKEYANILVAMPSGGTNGLGLDSFDLLSFYKYHDSNIWSCKH